MTRFGARLTRDGASVRLWAPSLPAVALVRPDAAPIEMRPAGDGFFEAHVAGARAGGRYRFRGGDLDFADPASRAQDGDADGWSLFSAALPPPRSGRAVRPWHEAVIAELHVGAASSEGTFAGLVPHLDHYVDAGITAVELMPVAEFMGARNWGYDGVLPFAPDTSYGPPDALRVLIDAAHDRGLGVLIDVVYNHFGPSGNYLPRYAADFFAPEERTPWGAAIALDNPHVRAFFCDNARMWLEEFDADGLRFDAVHAFRTDGASTFLAELAETARKVKPDAWLVLENDDNLARWLARDEQGRPRHFTAQWNDDDHHAFRVLTTGETSAHFADYGADPVGSAERALREGFVYQGEVSPHRHVPRGEPSGHLPPPAFVNFVQNHDQIGNRPMGDRVVTALADDQQALLRFIIMLAPQTPMVFMGEEAGLDTPFPFFCDFGGNLAEAVRQGRRAEFAPFFASHAGCSDDLPDPLAETTFLAAKMPWDRLSEAQAQRGLEEFRRLARLRRELVWPCTASAFLGASSRRSGSAILVEWRFADGLLSLALNLGPETGTIEGPARPPSASVGLLTAAGDTLRLAPWSGGLWAENER